MELELDHPYALPRQRDARHEAWSGMCLQGRARYENPRSYSRARFPDRPPGRTSPLPEVRVPGDLCDVRSAGGSKSGHRKGSDRNVSRLIHDRVVLRSEFIPLLTAAPCSFLANEGGTQGASDDAARPLSSAPAQALPALSKSRGARGFSLLSSASKDRSRTADPPSYKQSLQGPDCRRARK